MGSRASVMLAGAAALLLCGSAQRGYTSSSPLVEQLRDQIRRCWLLPPKAQDTLVTLRWTLRVDGSIEGDVEVGNPKQREGNEAAFDAAAEAAKKAVRACAPFNLPKDQYKTWRKVVWDFDPLSYKYGAQAEDGAFLLRLRNAASTKYLSSLKEHMAKFPLGSDAGGMGTLVIAIGRKGELASAKIVESSGIVELDMAALQMADSAKPYPRPPEWMVGKPIKIGFGNGQKKAAP